MKDALKTASDPTTQESDLGLKSFSTKGPPTNLRPAGAHKDKRTKRRRTRAAQLREELENE